MIPVPSLILLGGALVMAVVMAMRRPLPATGSRAVSQALLVAALAHSVHLAEEVATGLHRALPEFFGAPPMSPASLVAFNLFWLVLFFGAVPTLRRSSGIAPLTLAWFLAFAGCINLVAHPGLALAVGGYFPGLYTSPLIGATGVWLLRELLRAGEK